MENVDYSRTYTKKESVAYLTGLMGQNIIYNVIGASLAYYMQFTILIPAIAVSVIMAVARIWDAFNDPIMGTFVDKTRSKYGKCRPYLIVVPGIICLVTILCFVNFGVYGMGTKTVDVLIIAWSSFTYILWGMVYTIGDIPLWGLPSRMTESDKDRNKLLSLARVLGTLGGAVTLLGMQPLSLALGGMLAPKFGAVLGERYGFLIAAVLFSIIGCGMFQLVGCFVKEKIALDVESKPNTIKQNVKLIINNKPFCQVLFSGIFASGKSLLMLCAMPLVTYYFASKDPLLALVYMVLLGGGMFIGIFVATLLTPMMLKYTSKKKLYIFSNLIGIAPSLGIFIMYLIEPQNLTAVTPLIVGFLLFLCSGASFGFYQVLQTMMIADCVDYEEYHNNVRPDGVFFSGQTFITKLGSGIATIIAGIAYSIVGFSDAKVAEVNAFIEAGGIPRLEPQYQKFMMILFFLISIPPAISCILSVLPMLKYNLDDKTHKMMLEELNIRRHAMEEKE